MADAAASREWSPATSDDVRRILGEPDDGKLQDIMSLCPAVVDVEAASMWLAGDADIFGAGPALSGIAADKDEEPRQPK